MDEINTQLLAAFEERSLRNGGYLALSCSVKQSRYASRESIGSR
jgi:hypothetical protein